MTESLTIGVVGGMGPEATNTLCALITSLKPVTSDQDHVPVITYNNSRIPDRVRAISGKGESPVPEIVRTARILEKAGADFLVMPCNLAHFFIDEIQREIDIPILNMIDETVRHTNSVHPSLKFVGILASTPTISTSIYQSRFAVSRITLVVPRDADQDGKVMKAIYGPDGIKCGRKEHPRKLLTEVANELRGRGAEAIVAACTEVSIVMDYEDQPFRVIDPLAVLARAAINKALKS